jgi:hypothetical protein
VNDPRRPGAQDDPGAYPAQPDPYRTASGSHQPAPHGTTPAAGHPAGQAYDAGYAAGQADVPPGVVPAADDPAWDPVVDDTRPTQPGLVVSRYWSGAAVTVLVSALLGLACSVIFEEVFGLTLVAPDPLGVGHHVSWVFTGAVYALVAAVVLQLLVLAAPRARMFFGWLVALTTVILVALPFTGGADPLDATMTGLVWIVLGIAVFSMLSGVLGRTLVHRRPI